MPKRRNNTNLDLPLPLSVWTSLAFLPLRIRMNRALEAATDRIRSTAVQVHVELREGDLDPLGGEGLVDPAEQGIHRPTAEHRLGDPAEQLEVERRVPEPPEAREARSR